MSLLKNLSTTAEDNIQDTEVDSVGGGGVLDTNIYNCLVTLAFLQKSKSGALGLNLHFKTEEGREFRQTIYITSGDAKGNKNYYVNKDGEKKYLPGFLMANSLCLLAAGKEIAEMDTEDKVVKVYSSEASAEVPTSVEVLMELLDKPIKVALFRQVVDKRAKGDDGQYYPTGETREENEIDKFFRAKDSMTVSEIRAEAEEAGFIHTWLKKWEGKTRDRTSKDAGQGGAPKKAGGNGGNGGGAGAAAATKKPTQSLFG